MKITGAVLETVGFVRPCAESRPMAVWELDLAEPRPQKVLIKMEAAGVCHADLPVVNGDRPRPEPMLLGHEAAGIIVAVGSQPAHPQRRAVLHHLGVSGYATHAGSTGARSSRSTATPSRRRDGPWLCRADRRRRRPQGRQAPGRTGHYDYRARGSGHGCPADRSRRIVNMVSAGAHHWYQRKPGETDLGTKLGGHGSLFFGRSRGAWHPCPCRHRGSRPSADLRNRGPLYGRRRNHRDGRPAGARRDVVDRPPKEFTAETRTVVGSYLRSAVPSRDISVYAQMWREGRLPVKKLTSSVITLDKINEAMDELVDGKAIRQIVMFN